MSVFEREFAEFDKSTIYEIVESSLPENLNLEFKKQTYGTNSKDRKEFLKDISSFANSDGGILILGIEEINDVATKICPFKNLEKEMTRLREMANVGIEPAILGLQIKQIKIDKSNGVIVIFVPKSNNPPHRICFEKSYRYHKRAESTIYEPGVEELRSLFSQNKTVLEATEQFVSQRYSAIQSNEGEFIINLSKGRIVIHIIPLSSYGSSYSDGIDMKILTANSALFNVLYSSELYRLINLEGIINYSIGQFHQAYSQIHRNGIIESVGATAYDNNYIINSIYLIQEIYRVINENLKGLRSIGFLPPFLIKIAMLGVNQMTLSLKGGYFSNRIQRNEVKLPSLVISDFSKNDKYEHQISKLIHLIWNAFGIEDCNFLAKNGQISPS